MSIKRPIEWRGASAPVHCDHVLTLDEAIAHAEECADNTPCGSQHRQLADWLKELKALKTSVPCGNAAALREAAKYVQSTIERLRDPTDKNNAEFICIWEIVSAALAAPLRNCDVGTVEEQTARHREYWRKHHYCQDCKICDGTAILHGRNSPTKARWSDDPTRT